MSEPPGSVLIADIVVRPAISPRLTDPEAVERYRGCLDELPPITVQRGTNVLIAGAHRLEAHIREGRTEIRAVEMDALDADLPALAFLDNLKHGLPYTTGERVQGLRLLLERDPWSGWSNGRLAALVGLDADTVSKHRKSLGTVPAQVLTTDGRQIRNKGAHTEIRYVSDLQDSHEEMRESKERRSVVRTFEPDPEPVSAPVRVPFYVDPETGEVEEEDDYIRDVMVFGPRRATKITITFEAWAKGEGGIAWPETLAEVLPAAIEALQGLTETWT